jgi:hypothetical protein
MIESQEGHKLSPLFYNNPINSTQSIFMIICMNIEKKFVEINIAKEQGRS